jgi:hypothetical protein
VINEVNPNHPVTMTMHDHWHKVVAILMHQCGLDSFEITAAHLEQFEREYPNGNVVADARGSRFVIRLVTAEEGQRLARSEGGLPS